MLRLFLFDTNKQKLSELELVPYTLYFTNLIKVLQILINKLLNIGVLCVWTFKAFTSYWRFSDVKMKLKSIRDI